jgi:hypothetical protein
MPNLSLEDLRRRLNQQDSELQRLRQEFEARQNRLASLSKRKQEIQTQLQHVEAQMAALAAGTHRPSSAPPRSSPPTPRPSLTGKPDQLSLPALIVAMIREAGGPMTVKELAREEKRRGLKSKSDNFKKIVETRVYALRMKGILKRAADQPGFILARTTARVPASTTTPKPALKPSGQPQQSGQKTSNGKPATSASGKSSPKASAINRVPLRVVLTEVLKKSNKPMTGSELATQALRAGYRTDSNRFADVVWVMLNRMENVEQVPGQGYRLKKTKT